MRLSMSQLAKLSPGSRGKRKYGNIVEHYDGKVFDSRLEMRRWQELKLLWMTGQIQDLEHHRKFPLHAGPEPIKIGYYEADFTYLENGRLVCEDCKGISTALYRWKKAHLLAQYGIEIREIRAKSARTEPPTPL